MINAAGIVIILLALLVHVQVLFFLAQVLGSLSSVHGTDRARGGRRPKVSVIVPARMRASQSQRRSPQSNLS